jgi:type IV pilus secretin PilQ/predicted competence protein
LNNALAKELKESFKKVLSAVGSIEIDERSNSILVTDLPSSIATVERLVKELDTTTPQVMIEAKVIETVLGSTDKLGIDWTAKVTISGAKRPTTAPFEALDDEGLKNYLPLSTPTASGTVGTFPAVGTAPPLTGYPYSFPYTASTNFVLGTLNFSEFQMVLELLKKRDKTSLLSAPRITTLNNREAKVVVGTKIPIPTYERNATTGVMEVTGYEQQDVGITLKVTPNISPDGTIKLTLHPEVSSIVSYTGPNNERPIVSTREADTQVQLRDGQTVVIGGLIKEQNTSMVKRVPILGYIPILGFPFQKTEVTKEKTDLLIFVTAHILADRKTEDMSYAAMAQTGRKDIFKEDINQYIESRRKPLKAKREPPKVAQKPKVLKQTK